MTLYEECLQALCSYQELTEEDSEQVLDTITEKISFIFYDNIDWSVVNIKQKIEYFEQLDQFINEEVYLFWDNGSYPVLITTLRQIVKAWDDAEALGTKMWIVSTKLDFFLEYQHETLMLGFK